MPSKSFSFNELWPLCCTVLLKLGYLLSAFIHIISLDLGDQLCREDCTHSTGENTEVY